MNHNSHYLTRAAKEILEAGKYNHDAQYLQQQIASLLGSPDAALEFHPTVLSQLRNTSNALGKLLEQVGDDADVSLSIYDQNFEIVHTSGNERKSLYNWSYGAFRCEIGPRERRLLLLLIQKHPASLKLSDYVRDQVYEAYNTLCREGYGDMFEMPQKGYLCFKQYSQGSESHNKDMGDATSSSQKEAPIHERVDTNFGKIALCINDTLYDIKRLYTIDTYSISRKGRASTHLFHVHENIIEYLKSFLDGKQTTLNPHYNRELGKIGCKLVRKGGILSLEIIPDSALAKLN